MQIWPLDGGPRVADLELEDGGVSALALASDDGPLAGASGREVRLWDLHTRQRLRVLKYKAVVKSNKDSAFAQLAKQRIEDFENEDKYRDIQRFYQDLSFFMRDGQVRPQMPMNIEEIIRGMKKE